MDDSTLSIILYLTGAFIALVLLLQNLMKREMRDILAYAQIDELDYFKMISSKDSLQINEQIIEQLSQQVNLRIYRLVRRLNGVKVIEIADWIAIQTLIDRLEALRPGVYYEGGKLHVNISDFDIDYSILTIIHPIQSGEINDIVKEIILGFRYINTLNDLNKKLYQLKPSFQER